MPETFRIIRGQDQIRYFNNVLLVFVKIRIFLRALQWVGHKHNKTIPEL